jgi:hypothetical protein
MISRFFDLVINKPKTIYALTLVLVVALGSMIPNIKIDTDPENMLPADNYARVFHNQVKKDFNLNDSIVVGIANEQNENGIYNPKSLEKLFELTRKVLLIDGVISRDVMSLSEMDNISQEGPGTIRFNWLMDTPPKTLEQSLEIRAAVNRLPMLKNTLVSGNGKAAAIYIPIRDKNESYSIAETIRGHFPDAGNGDQFFLTGLPVAENQFGNEMFKQMAISAPMAGLMIFIIMWLFFRNVVLITAPMIVAMATVISTMGLLIGLGYSVHIMSSLIAIFLMPIAVVDSVHIMSEFSDRFKPGQDVKKVVHSVMCNLFRPMLFTTITSTTGFLSLMLTPIPPVQIFGAFVGFGILLAFTLTMVFIPAYVIRMSPKSLDGLSEKHHKEGKQTLLGQIVIRIQGLAMGSQKLIVLVFIGLSAFAFVGIEKIQINDNPINWFKKDHEIRIADRVLNKHFAGTYNAYLVFKADNEDTLKSEINIEILRLLETAKENNINLDDSWSPVTGEENIAEAIEHRISTLDDQLFASGDGEALFLEEMIELLQVKQETSRVFISPKILSYMDKMETALQSSDLIGKSNSLSQIIKTVNRELRGGSADDFKLPTSASGVSQVLMQYQSSHRPNDLWHFVTPDLRKTMFWLQLTSGDNIHMSAVLDLVDEYIAQNPLPEGITTDWGGKAYLNVIWQDTMVQGMFDSLGSAFVVVFIMMVLLFRSVVFGLLAMLPLVFTITFIYGLIGWIQKDYDMPIAVLSSLALGMSVDFAIHFVEHARSYYKKTNCYYKTMEHMFAEPARAITRNTLVISLGFIPLLFAPLVPYITVGIFLASIMLLSGLSSLLLLPAGLKLILKEKKKTNLPNLLKKDNLSMKPLLVFILIIASTAFLTLASPAKAEENNARALVEKANIAALYAGVDGRTVARMTIIDGQGRKQVRQFTILRKHVEKGGDQNYLVFFSRPSDVRGMVFRVAKHVEKDDDRWLYLPGLDLVKRISAGDKRTSFVGSHFLYEDISGRNLAEDTFTLVEETEAFYLITATPKNFKSVEFKNYQVWIDKKTMLPTKIEYKDSQDSVYRRVETISVKEIQGYPTVTKSQVEDLKTGGKTILEFRFTAYDLGLPDDIFSERSLRTPPLKWLKRK